MRLTMEKPKHKRKNEEVGQNKSLYVVLLILLIILLAGGLFLLLIPVVDPPSIGASFGESIAVPFNKIEPTYTQKLYSATLTLIISGTGQAGGTDWSDAFYLYAHGDGTPYEPPITEHFDLEIDGQRAIITLGLRENPPPYSSYHVYTVTYNVGAGARPIAFRISDSIVDDNTGEFNIEIRRGQ
jgi:hypothetical protein